MKKNDITVIYYGELDRFGYTLQAVDTTREAVKNAIMAEYIKAYRDINGGMTAYFNEDYKVAMEDLYIDEMKLGKVEWR